MLYYNILFLFIQIKNQKDPNVKILVHFSSSFLFLKNNDIIDKYYNM